MGVQFVKNSDFNEGINKGLTIGNIIAAILSWSANQSILWACFHCVLGWIYVIYYAIWKS